MNPALVALALLAYIIVRRRLRTWVSDRWLDDQISSRQAAVMYGVLSFAPLIFIFLVISLSGSSASPVVPLAFLGAATVFIGLMVAAIDYATARGVRQSLKRARHERQLHDRPR